MKKMIIGIIVLMMSATIAQAQTTHNPNQGDNASMSVKVITPFVVENYDGVSAFDLPDVIMGQVRDLPENTIKIFTIQKETDYTVRFNLTLPNPVDGVELAGGWHFFDTPPAEEYEGFSINENLFDWFGTATDGWLGIKLTKIDASSATTTGPRVFTVTCTGQYIGI